MGVGLQPLNRGVDFARGNAYIFFVKESQKKQRDEKNIPYSKLLQKGYVRPADDTSWGNETSWWRGRGWHKQEVMTSSREEGTGTVGSVMTPASTRFLLAVPKAFSISAATGKIALLGVAAILPRGKMFLQSAHVFFASAISFIFLLDMFFCCSGTTNISIMIIITMILITHLHWMNI